MNSTASLSLPREFMDLVKILSQTQFASGIFIAFLSLVTTLGNGLLIIAICRDPYKCFRTPTAFLMLGLAAADFITGAVACPLYASVFLVLYLSVKRGTLQSLSALKTAWTIGHKISHVTMNASYIILLLLSWSQFAAINFPYKHRVIVTKKRIVVSIVFIWAYSSAFPFLSFLGISEDLLLRIDLYVNTTVSLVLLIIAYGCLYRAFTKQMHRIRTIRVSTNHRVQGRKRCGTKGDRQFTVVNLSLVVFVIICTLPSMVILYMQFHWNASSLSAIRLEIANLIASDVLFLKMALDPLVYAWRLAQYRRALKALLTCRTQRTHVEDLLSFTTNNFNTTRSRRINISDSPQGKPERTKPPRSHPVSLKSP